MKKTQEEPLNLPAHFFVYGTLKRGFNNHRILNCGGAQFVCAATTVDQYPLVVRGLPYLIERPGIGHKVYGELYRVLTPDVVEALDRLEGHPRFYRRKCIAVRSLPDGPSTTAWVYFVQDYIGDVSPADLVPEYTLSQAYARGA